MFHSNRLTYRELEKSDWKLYYELYSNNDVMKFAYNSVFSSMEEARKSFESDISMQSDDNQGTQYVARLSNHVAIGIVDYEVRIKNSMSGIFEIGYFIKPEYWGFGYGTEMSVAIIDYLFQNYNIHKIVASCNCNNSSSENIMKKLGMSYEGKLRKTRFKNGNWDDEIKYGLLREEWNRNS